MKLPKVRFDALARAVLYEGDVVEALRQLPSRYAALVLVRGLLPLGAPVEVGRVARGPLAWRSLTDEANPVRQVLRALRLLQPGDVVLDPQGDGVIAYLTVREGHAYCGIATAAAYEHVWETIQRAYAEWDAEQTALFEQQLRLRGMGGNVAG